MTWFTGLRPHVGFDEHKPPTHDSYPHWTQPGLQASYQVKAEHWNHPQPLWLHRWHSGLYRST